MPEAHPAIPPTSRDVFVNDCAAAIAQYSTHFIQHDRNVLCVMQDITEQHRVERIIHHRKMRAVVTTIINRRLRTISHINSHDARAEQCTEMMRDKAAATAYIQNFRAAGKHARDLLCHVISAADFAPPPFARPAVFDSVNEAGG
jgi:hypothetical protein